MDPYKAPKERELKEIYESRKKLSFGEWKELHKKGRKRATILALIFVGLFLTLYVVIVYSVAYIRYYKDTYEEYREMTINMAHRECLSKDFGKFVKAELMTEGRLAIFCENQSVIIDKTWREG